MRKTLISLATASLIVSSAMAADKGVDFVTTGKAVLYYQTADAGTASLFGQTGARANAALQLNLDADLKNDFTFGSQINYLGTLGLEKNLVGNTMQDVQGKTGSTGISDDIYLSQFYIAKKIANTTVKLGRQELPKSLSPFAFSEDWNVFTNTFDAGLVVNSDIPNTTLVGAYVGGGNQNGMATNMAAYGNLTAKTNLAAPNNAIPVAGTAYMVTVQNKSLPMATITATYYDVNKVTSTTDGAKIVWGDVAIADKSLPMGLKIGVQGGQISPDASGIDSTTAYGAMVSLDPVSALNLTLAYSSVNDGVVAVKNVGGVKTPLYTQMTLNQDAIALDADTYMLKAAYNTGDYGTIIAQGTMTSAGAANKNSNKDFTDLELVYKVKAANVNYMAILANTKVEDAASVNTVRVVATYAF